MTLRPAGPADAVRLQAGLMALSSDLGDVHRADLAGLKAAGWGPAPAFRALLAEGASPTAPGAPQATPTPPPDAAARSPAGTLQQDMAAMTCAPDLRGLVLYCPAFSTARGGRGIYVSDLWVAAGGRSCGLGRRLLHAALADAAAQSGAPMRFLKLQVYDHTPRARRFYDRLGFVPVGGFSELILDAAACAALEGAT
ncbi:GNAT family N-acetyltransferase [Pseudooceanicola aestuarii]|uniref:GNAT family N-acetyltransferase n=1 Tax=Pseudooceanicola aestuarii TaxID=2697319 RepID=UPI001EF9B576|nr:GNAT family N-acetyltransferase [Pseudooceanicola aestuarii]